VRHVKKTDTSARVAPSFSLDDVNGGVEGPEQAGSEEAGTYASGGSGWTISLPRKLA
jgi:hypothetical protein